MRNLAKEEKKYFEKILKKKPFIHNGYFHFRIKEKNKYRLYKRSRILIQLYLNKKLEIFEHVHHKDRNKQNDEISNLEVLNSSEHCSKHGGSIKKFPEGWTPINKTKSETIKRIRQISSEMIKVNCSEISRRLKKEGINISSFTVSKYI